MTSSSPLTFTDCRPIGLGALLELVLVDDRTEIDFLAIDSECILTITEKGDG